MVHETRTGRFRAMASACEVLVHSDNPDQVVALTRIAQAEALRIEKKFSRFNTDSVVYSINHARGDATLVDTETARLLDFADQCFQMSEGAFDITSGVLGSLWHFNGSNQLPDVASIAALLPMIGWHKVHWRDPELCMPAGMQIDFGGIGKEYAVDRVAGILAGLTNAPILINFGGDLFATAPPTPEGVWYIGVESTQQGDWPAHTVTLEQGAMATSGDANRYLLHDGIRYGHVLDPRTGWPVPHAPRSVTVAGERCTEAGVLATLALLHGVDAEAFLEAQGVSWWCQRDNGSAGSSAIASLRCTPEDVTR